MGTVIQHLTKISDKAIQLICIMKVFIFCAIILAVSNVNGSPSAKVLRSHRPPAGQNELGNNALGQNEPACEDKLPTKRCEKRKALGKCSKKGIQKKCQKTCGLCATSELKPANGPSETVFAPSERWGHSYAHGY